MWKVTYVQERGPAIPSFDAYAERIGGEFRQLLDSDPEERDLQAFLERNPCMVPGAKTPINHPGSRPMHMALIARPPLHGFNGRVPDLMWLSSHSAAWFPAMIEIERPSKRVFNTRGEPTAQFSQARNQLAQWQTWLDDPVNLIGFMDHYGVDTYFRRHCVMDRHFLLIYGRREEFSGVPELSKARGRLISGSGEELLSYDRLTPDPALHNEVCVRAVGNGRFKVLHVPETFALHPAVADCLANLIGLPEAIDRNSNIPSERAAFLKKRIPEWTNWYQSHGRAGLFMDGQQFWE